MSTELHAPALIRIAEEFRDRRCAGALAAADETARRLSAESHRTARKRVREALDVERAQLVESLAEAQAQLVTARRVRLQKHMAAALAEAWPRLERALRERWQSPELRGEWVVHYLAAAKDVFPAGGWTILHPAEWPPEERAAAASWLQSRANADTRFEADAAIPAGIRIRCGMNLLDASLEGLLADRAAIEGRLLHYFGEFA